MHLAATELLPVGWDCSPDVVSWLKNPMIARSARTDSIQQNCSISWAWCQATQKMFGFMTIINDYTPTIYAYTSRFFVFLLSWSNQFIVKHFSPLYAGSQLVVSRSFMYVGGETNGLWMPMWRTTRFCDDNYMVAIWVNWWMIWWFIMLRWLRNSCFLFFVWSSMTYTRMVLNPKITKHYNPWPPKIRWIRWDLWIFTVAPGALRPWLPEGGPWRCSCGAMGPVGLRRWVATTKLFLRWKLWENQWNSCFSFLNT